ncbi:MAG: hypothetical protein ACTSYF_00680, partial [Promethearchaeota archaeon]
AKYLMGNNGSWVVLGGENGSSRHLVGPDTQAFVGEHPPTLFDDKGTIGFVGDDPVDGTGPSFAIY